MKKKVGLFLIGFSIFLFFVLFSWLTHKDLFTQIDFDTTVRLQDKIPRKLDASFSLFSLIGSFEIASIILIAFLLIRRRLMGVFVLFFYGSIHILELFGKIFVDHLPPPQFMLRTEKLADFPQFYIRAENSYPSGHSARAIFITTVIALWLLKKKKISKEARTIVLVGLLIFDILMLVSRIYLGEHWTSDVIGGSILGLSLAIISAIFI